MLNYVSPPIILFTITPFAPAVPVRLGLRNGHYLRVSVRWGFSSGNVTHTFPAGRMMLQGVENFIRRNQILGQGCGMSSTGSTWGSGLCSARWAGPGDTSLSEIGTAGGSQQCRDAESAARLLALSGLQSLILVTGTAGCNSAMRSLLCPQEGGTARGR